MHIKRYLARLQKANMHLISPVDNLLKYFQLLTELIENLSHFFLFIGSVRTSYKMIFLEQALS